MKIQLKIVNQKQINDKGMKKGIITYPEKYTLDTRRYFPSKIKFLTFSYRIHYFQSNLF